MVITWRTTKVQGGFKGIVLTVEYQEPSVNLWSGVFASRHLAKTNAQAQRRYYKRIQEQQTDKFAAHVATLKAAKV